MKELYAELDAKGIRFKPPVYLSDEWGVPEGVPIIGVPFYLAKEELSRLEKQLTDDLEDDQRISKYMRHEAGHALNYAYELFRSSEWTDLFGSFSRPYFDDYCPSPHSRQFVRHLPGWYAQMHPEEDFAETFAVWLTPDSDWRERYAGTGALPKLEYVERVMAEFGPKDPIVPPEGLPETDEDAEEEPEEPEEDEDEEDEDELDVVLADFYARRSSREPAERIGAFLDGDLRNCFAAGDGTPVTELLSRFRAGIATAISDMTGARYEIVRSLLLFVEERCDALGLRTDPENLPLQMAHMTALVTSLSFNYVRTGDFLGNPGNEVRGEKRL